MPCAIAPAGRAKQKQIGAGCKPLVAGGDGADLRLGDHRDCIEVEVVQVLPGSRRASDR